MSIVEVKVPDIGDFKEVEIIELMVKVGDTIKVDQSLVTVESDKASMEIPSSSAGVIKEIKVKVGDKVAEGSLLLLVEGEGAAAAPAPAAAAPAPAPAAAAAPAPAPAAAPAAAAGPVDVKVPDIGDFKEVEVIEVMVKVGDTIKKDQSLITVESDKASMEIPSSHDGVVKEIKVKVGNKVAEGSLVLVVESTGGGAAAPAPATAAPAPAAAPAAAASAPAPAPAASPAPAPAAAAPAAPAVSGKLAHASPSVRKFARELGVDVSKVPGTGQKGRITQQDVQNYVKGVIAGASAAPTAAPAAAGGGAGMNLLPWPSLDFSKFGETELQPLPRIKKISGPNLHRNWVMIPHVTQFEDADITDLEAFRVETNNANAKNKDAAKLTMLAFVIKASAAALKKYPAFNSSLDAKGENLILKKYYNIGFAADTPQGLVVPVVKNADQKSVSQIAREMTELSLAAREGKLKPADMQGATFTISSLGGIGGSHFTPIVNAPEVAILGLSKASMKPVWDGKQFVPRLMMTLSLSYDHRVVDGASGARFAVYLAEVLGDMRKVLL
ncbi:dihydrolipoyllysine-residue acetyltransferase [Pseudoduganella lutea]|uniref:Acetyltransferase component of pyruvate dehydrogenase complex n=1 Tax=Pseudoduganella lutea TaxID=321985 RepID=A0A4P6KZN0_9BURK|nr:dihydrolipoyllysine-residue acetyltransferase [Pseudoduganella lutea]QBE64719.1 dihydrolipoyllysine-residue acetyltransferase [Pseudoduganella lutea]